MAMTGLGILEDEPSTTGGSYLDASPALDDVHSLSTTVAELPAHLLEALKSHAFGTPGAEPPPPVSAAPRSSWAGHELVDLTDHLDADEAMTLQLDTVMLDVAELPPLVELPLDEAPPRTIELHVVRETDPLAAVDSALVGLPRAWLVAGALVASLATTFVIALLCWTLVAL